jgi:MFS family permease
VRGHPGQKWGGRETLRILAIFYAVSATGCSFAWNWHALLAARFIGGLAIGGSSVLGPVYIAELAPARTRGRRGSAAAMTDLKIGDRVVIHAETMGDKLMANDVHFGAMKSTAAPH